MDKGERSAKPVNVKFIMKTLFELQVAISKLAIALYEKEKTEGPLPRPADMTVMSAPPIKTASAGIQLNREGPIDEDCGEAPVPPVGDLAALDLLCRHLEEIMAYLRALCTVLRH